MAGFLTIAGMLVVLGVGLVGGPPVEAQEDSRLERIGRDLDGILAKLDERGKAEDRVEALREAQAELNSLLARVRDLYRGASDRSGERERIEFHLRYLIRWTGYLLQKSGAGEAPAPISGAEAAYRRGLEQLEAAERFEREHPEDRVGVAERLLAALVLLRGREQERVLLDRLNALWAELDDGAGAAPVIPPPAKAPNGKGASETGKDPAGPQPTATGPTGPKTAARDPKREPGPKVPKTPGAKKLTGAELKQVRENLAGGTPAQRIEAARLLATVKQSWVGGKLVQQLAKEDDPSVRAVLTEEVLAVGNRHVVRALGKWSRLKDPARRREAIGLLGRIEREDVGAALCEFAGDDDEVTTQRLVATAKMLPNGRGVAALAKTGKAHPALRFEVIDALGQTRHADAAKVLISFLHRRKYAEFKDPAIKALRMLGPAGIPPLIDALDGRDYRQYAAVALRSVTGERFGMSRGRWVQWWRKNRKRFEKTQGK